MGYQNGAQIVTNGLVLTLDAGDENSYVGSGTVWNDLTGNNNNGTLVNGPLFSSTNQGSLLFDGINDYISITNPTTFQSQNLTVSTWINPLSPINTITTILDYDHTSSPFQGWVLQSEDATTNRNYYFGYYDGSNFQPTGSIGAGKGIQITNSTWQNLTFTKSGTSVIGYLNGVQTYTATATGSTISYQSNRNFRISGIVSGSNFRVYNGNIVTTYVYNRALSASEVLQNYNAQKARFAGITTGPDMNILLTGTYTPTSDNSRANTYLNIGMNFYTTQSGYIKGFRYYKNASNTGTTIGYLYRLSDSTQIATASFGASANSGWQTANFNTPTLISANTNYCVFVGVPLLSGFYYYAAESGRFNSSVTGSVSYLIAPANNTTINGATLNNGTFIYSNTATSIPTGSFNQTNYGVDVVFNLYNT